MNKVELDNSSVERKHKGAWGEMAACMWLIQNGYEVFRNVSSHGYCDIVALKGTEVLKLDVKTGSSSEYCYLSKEQIENGIKILSIGQEGEIEIVDRKKALPHQARCLCCGKEFKPRYPKQRLCTTLCGKPAAPERSCITCGSQFIPRMARHVYCTDDCNPRHKKTLVVVNAMEA